MSLRFLTAGESHGKGLVGILEGLPSEIEVTIDYIQNQLRRRKLGYGRGFRQQIEDDSVEMISGVRFGKTLGSPISLLILNKDWEAWKDIMRTEPVPHNTQEIRRKLLIPRPGHADLVGGIKYHHSHDMRNVLERASARETTIRVGLASIARKFLEDLGICICSRVIQIGRIEDESEVIGNFEDLNQRADESRVRCLSAIIEEKMIQEIEDAKQAGDTLGGVFEVYATKIPIGLGSYSQWDRRIEAEIGRAFLSLNAIKGVEIGLGFKVGRLRGSHAHDEYFSGERNGHVHYGSNHSGGIDGGTTTGEPICIRAVMKPLSTLMTPLRSVHLGTGEPANAHIERSDVCAVPAAAVIAESLLAFVLADAILDKFGGDSMTELIPRISEWRMATS